MTAADYDDFVLLRKTHDAESTRISARPRTIRPRGEKYQGTIDARLELSVKNPKNAPWSPSMSPDSSIDLKPAGAGSRRDGGGAGITAAAVIVALLLGVIGIFDSAAGAAPQIGQPAPDFTAVDSKGNAVRLSEYRGKIVVLEWTNADCPYTRKHYSSGNMQG